MTTSMQGPETTWSGLAPRAATVTNTLEVARATTPSTVAPAGTISPGVRATTGSAVGQAWICSSTTAAVTTSRVALDPTRLTWAARAQPATRRTSSTWGPVETSSSHRATTSRTSSTAAPEHTTG